MATNALDKTKRSRARALFNDTRDMAAELFTMLNASGSGKLTREEMRAHFPEIDPNFDEARLERIFELLDPELNDYITVEAFTENFSIVINPLGPPVHIRSYSQDLSVEMLSAGPPPPGHRHVRSISRLSSAGLPSVSELEDDDDDGLIARSFSTADNLSHSDFSRAHLEELGVTEETFQELRRVFFAADTDHNGYIDRLEFNLLMEPYLAPMIESGNMDDSQLEELVDSLWTRMDVDGDGKMQFTEFLVSFTQVMDAKVDGDEDEDEDGGVAALRVESAGSEARRQVPAEFRKSPSSVTLEQLFEWADVAGVGLLTAEDLCSILEFQTHVTLGDEEVARVAQLLSLSQRSGVDRELFGVILERLSDGAVSDKQQILSAVQQSLGLGESHLEGEVLLLRHEIRRLNRSIEALQLREKKSDHRMALLSTHARRADERNRELGAENAQLKKDVASLSNDVELFDKDLQRERGATIKLRRRIHELETLKEQHEEELGHVREQVERLRAQAKSHAQHARQEEERAHDKQETSAVLSQAKSKMNELAGTAARQLQRQLGEARSQNAELAAECATLREERDERDVLLESLRQEKAALEKENERLRLSGQSGGLAAPADGRDPKRYSINLQLGDKLVDVSSSSSDDEEGTTSGAEVDDMTIELPVVSQQTSSSFHSAGEDEEEEEEEEMLREDSEKPSSSSASSIEGVDGAKKSKGDPACCGKCTIM